MTIFEIGLRSLVTRHSNVSPFTYVYTPFPKSLPYFWTSVFGVLDESTNEKAFVLSVIINYITRFNRVLSLVECKNTFHTYFFDYSNQQVYINYGLDYHPSTDITEYLKQFGFCDENVIYIDDFEYLPLLKESISISKQQDLINYSKIAYSTGTVSLLNNGGDLDFLNTMSLYSNDAVVYHLEKNETDEYTRDDLEPVAYMLVDDITVSLRDGKISLKDVRESLDVSVPIDTFTEADYPNAETDLYGKPIPLLFGIPNDIPAICTNGNNKTGVVTYRLASELVSLGTVYVLINDNWTIVIPISINLSRGEFVLSELNGRGSPGEDARGCKVIGSQGYVVNHAPDVIVKLESLSNGVEYTESNYDLTEWNSEASTIEPISLYIDKQKKLYDIIKQIQEGSSTRFRFDFNASGLRTIRINKWDRTPCAYVYKEDYLENGTIEIETDRETIAAFIEINYNKNYSSDKYLTVIDQSKVDEVVRLSRTKKTISYDTFIETKETAALRAADDADKLGRITKFCEITLIGKESIFRRIYDIITVELYTVDRKWLGVWNCLVIKVSPDIKEYKTKVKLALLEKIADVTEVTTIRIDDAGNIRTADTAKEVIKVV